MLLKDDITDFLFDDPKTVGLDKNKPLNVFVAKEEIRKKNQNKTKSDEK